MDIDQLRGETGRKLGQQVLDRILEASLPATPHNYEIWLNHTCGWHPALSKALAEVAERSNGTWDQRDIEELYDRFFTSRRYNSMVMEAGGRIALELSGAVAALKDAGVATRDFGNTLDKVQVNLTDDLSLERLRGMIGMLTTATREVSEKNRDLSARLVASTQQVESLRNGLLAARAEALTDPLTGVANRKLFDDTMQMRVAEANGTDSKLCLVLGDIDRFKSFNDTWGHQTGDQVIRFVASTLQRFALGDQLVARYGGEEFAVIMPRTTLEAAEEQANAIRRAVEAKRLIRRSTNEELGAVTISMGIAQFVPGESIQSLIERADACLYASKRNGRNRVTVETASPSKLVGKSAA
jgi:diguanylate cyclase